MVKVINYYIGIEAIGIEDQVMDETIPDTAKSLLTKIKIKILPKLSKKNFMVRFHFASFLRFISLMVFSPKMLSNSLRCTPITSPDMLSNLESKKKLCKASILLLFPSPLYAQLYCTLTIHINLRDSNRFGKACLC